MTRIKMMILALGLSLTACVTIEEKISLVNATALDDLGCDDQELTVEEVGEDRFSAQCGRRRAMYMVNCPKGPDTCLIKRLR